MKKSEFEARRRHCWDMILPNEPKNARVQLDIEAAEAAGVKWDSEVEELGEIEVGRHCVLVRKGFDGLGALSLQEKEALCRWWNAGGEIDGAYRKLANWEAVHGSGLTTSVCEVRNLLAAALAVREVRP